MATASESLMAKLNPKWVQRFKALKSHEQRVALARDYPIQTGEEEAIIQILIDRLDPARPSQTRVTAVRDEMQREEAKGTNSEHKLDNIEGEKYWQERLDTAGKLDEIDRKAEVKRRHDEIRKMFPNLLPLVEPEFMEPNVSTGPKPTITVNPTTKEAKIAEPGAPAAMPNPVPNGATVSDMKDVPGFGKNTIENFKTRGIICQKQLFELTYNQALAIARTPLVLVKVKEKFQKES